jgi:monovalent cation:H+ antiporter, CPA1 family
LRGGILVAKALSLPPLAYRDAIITAIYFVVVFSIVAQGLTIGRILLSRAKIPNEVLQTWAAKPCG